MPIGHEEMKYAELNGGKQRSSVTDFWQSLTGLPLSRFPFEEYRLEYVLESMFFHPSRMVLPVPFTSFPTVESKLGLCLVRLLGLRCEFVNIIYIAIHVGQIQNV
jgi:hypothetical protein